MKHSPGIFPHVKITLVNKKQRRDVIFANNMPGGIHGFYQL